MRIRNVASCLLVHLAHQKSTSYTIRCVPVYLINRKAFGRIFFCSIKQMEIILPSMKNHTYLKQHPSDKQIVSVLGASIFTHL